MHVCDGFVNSGGLEYRKERRGCHEADKRDACRNGTDRYPHCGHFRTDRSAGYQIDTSQPVEKKLAAFAEQTKNIYVNRIGDYVVKVRFQESGATIDDKMAEYLRRMSEIYI